MTLAAPSIRFTVFEISPTLTITFPLTSLGKLIITFKSSPTWMSSASIVISGLAFLTLNEIYFEFAIYFSSEYLTSAVCSPAFKPGILIETLLPDTLDEYCFLFIMTVTFPEASLGKLEILTTADSPYVMSLIAAL